MFFKGLSSWLEDKPTTTSILLIIVVFFRYTQYTLENVANNLPVDKIGKELEKICQLLLTEILKYRVENKKKEKCEECPCEDKSEEKCCDECPCEDKSEDKSDCVEEVVAEDKQTHTT